LIDGVAHRCIRRSRALCAHVAFGCEARQQIRFRRLFREDHAPRDRLLHGLQVFSAGMQKEMNVRVNQPWQQCRIAEIDEPRALRVLYTLAHRANTIALDQHLTGLAHHSGIHVEQSRRVQNNRCRGIGLLSISGRYSRDKTHQQASPGNQSNSATKHAHE
jgi:hypothetical protein